MSTTHTDLLRLTMRHAPAPSIDARPLLRALWERLHRSGWVPNPHAYRADGDALADHSDRALLEAFVRGTPEAFDLLVTRHAAALLGFAQRSLCAAEAHDAVQEAYLALFRKGATVLAKPHQNIRAFLFGATRLAVVDELRRRTRTRRALDSYAHHPTQSPAVTTPPDAIDPLAQVLAREDRTTLLGLIERACNPLEQDVLVHVLDGRSNPEIADALDLEPNHVGVLKHRARRKLERTLGRGAG